MTDNRRIQETASLRAFFDEQIQHLHSLWDFQSEAVADQELQVVEQFVDTVNKRVRAVQGYAETLRHHVCLLYQHVLGIAAQIPPPIELNSTNQQFDPLLNALFVNSRDMDSLFCASGEIGAYCRHHNDAQVPVIYGLLTATKTEKSSLGVGMLGTLLVRDVQQQTVNFLNHTLHAPCADSDTLAAAIKAYLFERVVMLIRQELASRMLSESNTPGVRTYQTRLNSLSNPQVYLQNLLEQIENPARLLSIEKSHLLLNKLGIKLERSEGQYCNEFDVHELTWGDRSRNVVLQIAYAR